MAGRKGTPPKATVFVQTPGVKDPELQRAFDVVNGAIKELQARQLASSAFDVFTASSDGLVPASGGGTSNFLRADGTWAPAPGGVSSVNAGSAAVVVSPTTGAVVIDVDESQFSGIPMASVTFSGTNNRLPKFSGTTLADSSITDDGSLVTVNNPLKVTGATDLDSTLNVDGAATLQSTLTLPLMTQGSVLFAGTGGLVSQDNANLFWDDSNSRLGIGTAAPTNPLTLSSTGTSDMVSIRNTDATLWSTYVARDDGGTVRTAFGYGNASTADTPRNARAHWWAESGTDFVFMRGGAIPGTALGYIHNTSGNWNIGSTLGDPSSRLRVEGRLSVIHPTTAEAAVILRNSSVSGYTSTDLYDSANAFKGGYGYANASAGVTHLRSQLYLYSGGPDWQFANGTRNEVTVGMTTGSTMLQLQNGSSAAVSAASTGRLRYNTTGQKFQVSHNAGTYTDILIASSAGVGVSNTVPKWSAANALGNSLLTDNATTLSYNSGKFTVTAASGNTTIAGTLGVTGLSTLTGGFTLGADSSANSHKITNLTNGSAAQDAATFGQIGTAVSAAVSGTANAVAMFTGGHTVGDSPLVYDGSAAFSTSRSLLLTGGGNALQVTGSTADVNLYLYNTGVGGHSFFLGAGNTSSSFPGAFFIYDGVGSGALLYGNSSSLTVPPAATFNSTVTGSSFISGNLTLGANALNNSGSALYLQFYNPANGVVIGDGVTACPVTVHGALALNGNATIGDAATDNHTMNGRVIGNTSGFADGFDWTNTASAAAYSMTAIGGHAVGTFNTTAGARAAIAGNFSNTASRSSGANSLTNYAVYASATNGQANYSFYGAAGDIYNAGNLSVAGNVTLGDATSDAHTVNGVTTINSGAPAPPYVGLKVLSGSGNYGGIGIGRTGIDGYLVAAGASNNYNTGTVAGDTVLFANGGNLHLSTRPLDAGTVLGLSIDTSGTVTNTAPTGNKNGIRVNNSATGQTGNNHGVSVAFSGTYDTSGGGLFPIGVESIISATRSAGASTLTSIALYASATGAQVNYGIWVDDGDARFDGNVTLGDGTSDAHTLNGSVTLNSTTATQGQTIVADVNARPVWGGDGYVVVPKTANQDVTNAGVTDDAELAMHVTAGKTYAIEMQVIASGSDSAGDYAFRFRVDTGTMSGRGHIVSATTTDGIQTAVITSAAAANTNTISIGTASDVTLPVAITVRYCFLASSSGDFYFQFGNNTTGVGRISRTFAGSYMKWKQLD